MICLVALEQVLKSDVIGQNGDVHGEFTPLKGG